VTDDWFWEGHVQAATVAHLVRAGWTIERAANTARREQGIDVIASKDGRRLAVEVKGFPSALYARGSKAGQPKPTSPALQARHWFAGALLASILTTSKLGRSELALALPDVPASVRSSSRRVGRSNGSGSASTSFARVVWWSGCLTTTGGPEALPSLRSA
jgi:hypothetical protein